MEELFLKKGIKYIVKVGRNRIAVRLVQKNADGVSYLVKNLKTLKPFFVKSAKSFADFQNGAERQKAMKIIEEENAPIAFPKVSKISKEAEASQDHNISKVSETSELSNRAEIPKLPNGTKISSEAEVAKVSNGSKVSETSKLSNGAEIPKLPNGAKISSESEIAKVPNDSRVSETSKLSNEGKVSKSPKIMGFGKCAFVKALGRLGYNCEQAQKILAHFGVEMPEKSVRIQLYFGKNEKFWKKFGKPAELSEEQKSELKSIVEI